MSCNSPRAHPLQDIAPPEVDVAKDVFVGIILAGRCRREFPGDENVLRFHYAAHHLDLPVGQL